MFGCARACIPRRKRQPTRVEVCSGCAAVSVMKAADLRNRDNSTPVGRFNLAFHWRVAIQGQVSSRFMVVHEVRAKDTHQVSLVDNDEMIQTLSADRAYEPLTIRILPGRARRANDFLDSHVSDALLKHVTIDAVAIAN